jgi:hypothetical protein
MLFTMLVPVYGDAGLSKDDGSKSIDSTKLEEVKVINENLKIYKAYNEDTKEKLYIITKKVHNQDAPKDLPKDDGSNKFAVYDEKAANAEDTIWVDRVYFTQASTLEEAEAIAKQIEDIDNNSLGIESATYADLGNGSYMERIYTPLRGYGYRIHFSPDDAAFLKDSLSHCLYFDGAMIAAVMTLGFPGLAAAVVGALSALISNVMLSYYYYEYKNEDGSFDIYIYDVDLAYQSFGVPGVVAYGAYLGKARLKGLYDTLRTVYWMGKTIYIESNYIHE